MKHAVIALTAGVALCASPAIAAPTVVSTRPVADDIGAKVHFLVGGIEESGRSLKTTELTVSVDGQPAAPGRRPDAVGLGCGVGRGEQQLPAVRGDRAGLPVD